MKPTFAIALYVFIILVLGVLLRWEYTRMRGGGRRHKRGWPDDMY